MSFLKEGKRSGLRHSALLYLLRPLLSCLLYGCLMDCRSRERPRKLLLLLLHQEELLHYGQDKSLHVPVYDRRFQFMSIHDMFGNLFNNCRGPVPSASTSDADYQVCPAFLNIEGDQEIQQ